MPATKKTSPPHKNSGVAFGVQFWMSDNLHIDFKPLVVNAVTPAKLVLSLKASDGKTYHYKCRGRAGFDFTDKSEIKRANIWRRQILRRRLKVHKNSATRGKWTEQHIAVIKGHVDYQKSSLTDIGAKELMASLPGRSMAAIVSRYKALKASDTALASDLVSD